MQKKASQYIIAEVNVGTGCVLDFDMSENDKNQTPTQLNQPFITEKATPNTYSVAVGAHVRYTVHKAEIKAFGFQMIRCYRNLASATVIR